MNSLQRFGSAIADGTRRTFSAAATATTTITRSFAMTFVRGASWGVQLIWNRTKIDYQREIGDAMTNSIVVAVVGWIARNFPDAPVRVVKLEADGSRTVVPVGQAGAGYMLWLLEHPNPWYSGPLLWNAVVVDYYTKGDGYIYKERADPANTASRIVRLWWLPERYVMPRGDETTFVKWYEYTPNGTIFRIDPENIVHFRYGMDPENPRRGRSPLRSVLREIYSDDEAGNFTAQLLTNLGVPGVVLAPSNTSTGAVRTEPETVKRQFMEKFGGDRRGEPLVLTAPTDIKVLSWSPEQMNLRDIRKLPEERISAVTGVPASVANLGAGLDRNTFTNYGEARAAAYEEAVIPQHRMFAAELEVQLLDDFVNLADGWDVEYDYTNVRALQGYADAVWKRTQSAAAIGLITRAAFKKATNQPFTDADDVYVMPNNYVVVDAGDGTVVAGGQIPPGGRSPAPPQLPPPRAASSLEIPGTEVVATTAQAGEVRCAQCDRLLAEQASPPYRMTCTRCKAVTESPAIAA